MSETYNKKPPFPKYDLEKVRDLSVAVYKRRLGPDDTRTMIEKDGDNGEKLRNRAQSYDVLTKCYLEELGIELS